jgi:hypothetical protein
MDAFVHAGPASLSLPAKIIETSIIVRTIQQMDNLVQDADTRKSLIPWAVDNNLTIASLRGDYLG